MAQSIDNVAIEGGVILDDRYPDRRFQFPNGVTTYADIVYAVHTGYRPLILDLYVPPAAAVSTASRPLLLFVHGGGWQSGHTRHSGAFADWPSALASIAKEGIVVASVEYRLSGEAPFPAAFDDVRDAIRWLRANAGKYDIDRSKAVIMGGSAGGQLAGLVGTACGDSAYPASSNESSESACVQGVITWYGIFDFSKIVPVAAGPEGQTVPSVLANYLGCHAKYCDESVVRAASPTAWIDAADPPFLLIHGIDDPIASIEQSRTMHKQLEDAGVPARLIEIPGVKHSFVGESPEATIDASRKAWDASIAFILQTLVKE